jgi:hypothetical protein
MTLVLTAVLVVCTVAIGVLGCVVVRLRRQVDTLASRMSDLATRDPEESGSSPSAAPTRSPGRAGPRRRRGQSPVAAPTAGGVGSSDTTQPTPAAAASQMRGPDDTATQPATRGDEPVAVITGMAAEQADDLDLSVSRVASVTLAGPLVKIAAFSHGLRRALDEESRMRISYAMRKELKRQRKLRRQRARHATSTGWRP